MGKRSAPQRPMKGFSKIVFGDEGEAVAAMATYLGIDPVEDKGLLWVAEHAVHEGIPAGWAEFRDEHGETFFHHARSKTSQYDHPLDEHFDAQVASERRRLAAEDGGGSRQLEPQLLLSAAGTEPAPEPEPVDTLQLEPESLPEPESLTAAAAETGHHQAHHRVMELARAGDTSGRWAEHGVFAAELAYQRRAALVPIRFVNVEQGGFLHNDCVKVCKFLC